MSYKHLENYGPAIGLTVCDAVTRFAPEGSTIIYRDAFRWMEYCGAGKPGEVMPNHFEGMSIEDLCADFGHELILHLYHVAIIRRRHP